MKLFAVPLLSWLLLATPSAVMAQESRPLPRVVDLKASDGTILKASYFAAAKPGPGVLLLHQINRTRIAWDGLAAQLAAAGINTLTLDMRGYGESGGAPCAVSLHASPACDQMPSDLDAALNYLASQPGVERDVIGVGGAGLLGVDNSVQTARRHPVEVKSLALLSGETFLPDIEFLRNASQLPGLFVVADKDEYPPTVEAMKWLYISSSNPGKKLVYYSAAQEAPWLWYEPHDVGRVPASGGHGTDLFKTHPELPGIIVDWFMTTLIRTPGHAPADALASAAILNQIEMPGGVAQVTQQLTETRRKDPNVELFPEVNVDIIGSDHLRAGHTKTAIEIYKLNVLGYPDSADAQSSLADAYLADGQKDLARQCAEKALTLLDSHAAPASSWSDTEERRGVIRKDIQDVLEKLDAARAPSSVASGLTAGAVFRDCPDCPEVVVIPAGSFTMGSPPEEQTWAASHGAKAEWVSDESPQRPVSLRSFALGKYDVTRGGTTTRFWWGDDDAVAPDNAWLESNSGGHTHPVGLKPANRFGLYDIVGNVWQWTEDCYADSYSDVPTDGSASEIGDACRRVDRGSSWFYPAWLLRPAVRDRNPASYRDMMMGFRLARSLQ